MPTLEVDKSRVFYRTWIPEDDAPKSWVTLVNGFMRTHRDFNLFALHLLKQGYGVIALDNRGAGDSKAYDDFDLHDIAKDHMDVWSCLGVKKSHLVGLSMGGIIAQYICRQSSEKVSSLTLISSAVSARHVSINSNPWPKDYELIKKRLANYFHPSYVEKNHLILDNMAKGFLKEIDNSDFNRRADLQRQAMKSSMQQTLETIKAKIPMYVIHGQNDLIIPFAAAEEAQMIYPHAKILGVENTGHLLLAEMGSQLYMQVEKFIGEIDH